MQHDGEGMFILLSYGPTSGKIDDKVGFALGRDYLVTDKALLRQPAWFPWFSVSQIVQIKSLFGRF